MHWGIDLGGTKIEGVVLADRDADSVMARHRVATESGQGYEHILGNICRLVDHLAGVTGEVPDRVGIGTPGTVEPATGRLKNSNTLCLNGMPVGRDLSARLGVPVRIANDANCFALAEYRMGVVARDFPSARVMFGVIMGTGVGGGIVVDGNVIGGLHGIGGEWGHMTLVPDGDPCYCGRRGCVETVLSGPALQRFYEGITGVSKPLPEILALPDDPAAQALRAHHLEYYGRALGQVINLLDPDVIVLGGGVGHTTYLYTEGRAFVANHIFNTRLDTPIVRPLLGDSAGVFGAAMLAIS